MPELSVVALATEDEQRGVIQLLVDGTTVARTLLAVSNFPVGSTDALLRRIQDLNPDVIIVDIPAANASAALRAIDLLHIDQPRAAIFAIGDIAQPQNIVAAMRAGAREFIERPATSTSLLEAFVRLTSSQHRSRNNVQQGKVFSMVNAKGGSGATTVAVNTALALQAASGGVALVDVASLGHAALHLNLKPQFTLVDALRNLHRLDSSLMETYMVRHGSGLQLLAGPSVPLPGDLPAGEFARLFDLLVTQFKYVVVDASSRLDPATRIISNLSELTLIVACADVASLWSASCVHQYLSENGKGDRLRLLLNRFRKIAGFSESDVEAATGAKLFWKIPNQFPVVSAAIDRGIPVAMQNHSDVARAFFGLASALSEPDNTRRGGWSMFKSA